MEGVSCCGCSSAITGTEKFCPNCGTAQQDRIQANKSPAKPNDHLPGKVVFGVLAAAGIAIWLAANHLDLSDADHAADQEQRIAAEAEETRRMQAIIDHASGVVAFDPDATVGSGITPEAVVEAVLLTRRSGYRCDSLSFLGAGTRYVRLTCNGNRYVYQLRDQGAGWFVRPED